MKKSKIVAGSTALTLVMSGALASVNTTSAYGASRLGGVDRYDTATKVAENAYPKGTNYAIIARGDVFADAICAVPLSKTYSAPILLTESGKLTAKTKDELTTLKIKNVFIIGGVGAISKSVEDEITALQIKVERLDGADRYATSAKVATKLGKSSKVVLATGNDFADALSIASIAAVQDMPVLLTDKDSISKEVMQYIKDNKIEATYIVGGTGVVSTSVEKDLKNVERIAGENRFETNAKIMDKFEDKLNFEKVYLAVGDGPTKTEFADALAGGALAAKTSSPVVLTYNGINEKTLASLNERVTPKTEVVALGGEKVVSKETVDKVKANGTDDKAVLASTTVKGNLYVYGNGANLKSVTVTGTVFVDPGETGVVELNGVTADKIVVLSGDKNSVHIKGTKAKALYVNSKNASTSVRVTCEEGSAIGRTVVNTTATLEAMSGSFGPTIISRGNNMENVVTLKGNFKTPVISEGYGKVAVDTNAVVDSLTVAGNSQEINLAANSVVRMLIVNENVSGKISVTGEGRIDMFINLSFDVKIKIDDKLNIVELKTVTKDALDASSSLLARATVVTLEEGKKAASQEPAAGGGFPIYYNGNETDANIAKLEKLINIMVDNANKFSVVTNNVKIAKDGSTGAKITLLDNTLSSKTFENIAMMAISRVKTEKFDAAKVALLKQMIGYNVDAKTEAEKYDLKIDGKTLTTYVAEKLDSKVARLPHGEALVKYLKSIESATDADLAVDYARLQAKLNSASYDEYNELVAAVKKAVPFASENKIPKLSYKTLTLTNLNVKYNDVVKDFKVGELLSVNALKAKFNISSATKISDVKNVEVKITLTGAGGSIYNYTIKY